MKRAILAAAVLLAGLGGLCTAWYASSQRALTAELHEREHRALRATADRERAIAENLARRLEELRRDESQRPYFHYQNLYHDPKGASEGLSIVPSPLASGPGNPLISAHFQIDDSGRVTLPTVNEELTELNTGIAAEQAPIRNTLGGSVAAMRDAAAPLLAILTSDDALSRETAERIADLEARLAASQAAFARRTASASRELPPAPQVAQKPAAEKKDAPKVNLSQKSEFLEPSEFMQNVRSNEVYRELKQRAVNTAPQVDRVIPSEVEESPDSRDSSPSSRLGMTPDPQPSNPQPPTPAPDPPARSVSRRAPKIEIRTTDLNWHTITVAGKPRLVALRGVRTPEGNLLQGMLTPLIDGNVLEGATLQLANNGGTSIEGTGWRLRLDPAASLAAIRREQARDVERFRRMFVAVTALLLLVVAGTVWMVSRAEALAIEKSRFAATAAHELRTPLASLRLYSEMIADERDPVRRERYAREIAGQTERLGRLVANVLEVTRIERGTFAL